VRPEWAPLLSSCLSSPAVDRCLRLWPIFSYAMSCFGFWLPSSVSTFSFLFHLWVLPHFLVGFCSIFYA
jgi:hypothetical protein